MEGGNVTQVVEEFPRPPAYYQLFTTEKKQEITPPEIPKDGEDIYEQIYSGMLATSKLPFAKPTPEMMSRNIDFNKELKSSLKKIIRAALPLLSMPSNQFEDVAKAGELFRSEAYEFHQLLSLYRDHEAKEELYQILKLQVVKAKEVRANLQQCLERNEAALEKVTTNR